MKIRHRAYAYITHGSRLLLFTQPDPKAGIQVPAGTVKECENPADAVLRESLEETGLTALRLVKFLDQDVRDMRDCGVEELQHRWFYHIACDETPPEKWRHGEFDDAGNLVHPFDFFWAPLSEKIPALVANYDDKLPLLQESLKSLTSATDPMSQHRQH
ncbi:MAG: hydrolase [Rariglobus sp.]|jgi:8-oxo-dGTP pyrophosphatase MutT (NUDIX family)|nr:hydrolase [Rariglobus sp.]